MAWREVVAGAEALGVFEITLTGGEPLLWGNLAEALAASQDLQWASLEILTNALVLTPRRVAALRKGKVARVCVSLDGVGEAHELNRGQGTYAKTLEGIARVREVVDNVTVISVLDTRNVDKWPELTHKLCELGVRQHHLAPVCFSGHAMNDFRGLTREDFETTRARVDDLVGHLPAGFTLRFNDGLLHAPVGRRISISSLVEVVKGLHLQVMPDGEVRSAVRVWGRSWRANEKLGDLAETGLQDLVERSTPIRAAHYRDRFSLEDEVRDKFHIGADPGSIRSDVAIVRSVETGTGRTRLAVQGDPQRPDLFDNPQRFAEDQAGLARCVDQVASDPDSGRLRIDRDIGMVFDATSFDVTLLTVDEADQLAASTAVPARRTG